MKKKYINYLFFTCVVCYLLITLIINTIFDSKYLVLGIFGTELMILILAIFNCKMIVCLSKTEQMLFVIFIFSQLLMYIVTSAKYDIYFFDVHKLMLCCGMIGACYICTKKTQCDELFFEKICNILLVIGIVAIVYNFILNHQFIITTDINKIIGHGFYNKSFFSARAAYGTFLNICAIVTLLSIEKKNGLKYWGLYIVFFLNVLITGARAQIISLFIGTIVFLLHDKKYKYLLITFLGILFLYLLLTNFSSFSMLFEKYSYFFDHSVYRTGDDITTGRIDLWKIAFENMSVINILFGLGIGSKDTIMGLVGASHLGQSLSSFHSGYVDLFFETGLLGYLVWGGIIVKVYRSVYKNCPSKIRNFLFSLLVVFLISNVFDACNLIFTTDTLSPISSFLIVTLSNSTANYYRKRECL